jgi:hypothetical protein
MFFTGTQRYQSPISKEDFKRRLNGNHVKIHDVDFEVMERNQSISIIPHAEQVTSIKTLPITHVDLKQDGKVVVTTKMRKIDSGGPQLVLIFCAFMFIASLILMYVGNERTITYTMLGIASLIFVVFMVRMQLGYFDYVRKIRAYVKSVLEMNDASLGMR